MDAADGAGGAHGMTPRRRPHLGDLQARIAQLEAKAAQHLDLIETVAGSLRASDAGARGAVDMVMTQLLALRDLLISAGVLRAEDVLAAARIADLERMFTLPPKPPHTTEDPHG
jgi:hypothetical protein